MAPPRRDDDIRAAVAAWRAHGGSRVAAAKALGIKHATFCSRLRIATERGLLLDERPAMPGFAIAERTVRHDAAGHKIGETITERPERPPAGPLPAGHAIKGVSRLLDAAGNEVLRWEKTREGAVDPLAFASALREAMLDARGSAPEIAPPADGDEDLLTVYVVPDLHLGMMAWHAEAGESYDLKIAAATVRSELARLVAMSPPAAHAALLFLGDFFHQNDQSNRTPRSGHQLDTDGRWRKVFGVGARVAVAAADMIAARHRDVEVVTLPGNHDEDAARALDVALELRFEGHARIRVPGTAGLHWFRRHGAVLIGATHGHTMKPDRMAMMLAAERAEDWGASRFRRLFFGHVHHERKIEVPGAIVESFSAVAARDAYAAGGGYRSERALNAITFHRDRGEVSRHRVTIGAG